jgi:alpha-ketoglutarate-dependent taurine dioxygenase
MVATVEPLPGLSFGCRVSGVDLGPGMSEADFAVVSAAFEEYALVMLEEQHALTPADEVDLRSRLLRLWPQSQPQDGSGSGSDSDDEDGSAPPRPGKPDGFSELSIFGNGRVDGHFGIFDYVARPANWHEEKSLEWHLDGPSGRRGDCVLSYMSCWKAPTAAPWGHVSYEAADGSGATLSYDFAAGATLFADNRLAYELAPPEEKVLLRTLQARYWGKSYARGRDSYPLMSDSGLRVVHPPADLSELDMDVSWTQPLVLDNPGTGKSSIWCETVMLARLEPMDGCHGEALSWEDSQALIARVWGRAATQENILAVDWRPGQVIFWDNRSLLHSRTPTDYYSTPLDKSKPDGSVEYTAEGPGMQRLMHNMRISVDVDAQSSFELQVHPQTAAATADATATAGAAARL